MEAVTGKKFESAMAVLDNYERFKIKQQIYPGIIPVIGQTVYGRLYFDLDTSAINFLDAFEDVLYERKTNVVSCNNEEISAAVYVVNDKYRNLLSKKSWNIEIFQQRYLETYLDSCKKFHREYKRYLQD